MAKKTQAQGSFNRASFVAFLFILGALSGGVFSLLGLIFAYVWSDHSSQLWQHGHFIYLMRTFWLALIGNLIAGALAFIGIWKIGAGLAAVIALWSLVRAVNSFAKAVQCDDLPDPLTYVV